MSYSPEFKQEAIRLAIESSQPIAQTARDLGVNPNTLYTWVTNYRQQENPGSQQAQESPQDELKRLRQENARLKEERDILKKAAAYFAKNSR